MSCKKKLLETEGRLCRGRDKSYNPIYFAFLFRFQLWSLYFTDSLEGHIPLGVLPSRFVLVWPHKDNGAEQTGAALLWEGVDATRMGKKLGILAQTPCTGR